MFSKEKEKEEGDKLDMLVKHFEWVRVLGEGTFGKVFLIRNKVTKKEYALKQFNRSQLEKHNKYRSLIRSLYILQSLNHPRIIKCINYIVPPDEDIAIYCIFQSCKRGSLENLKKHLHSLKLNSFIKLILLDLAEALAYLKNQEVAHRDLKPSNITFNKEGQLKLIDFDEAVCFEEKMPNLAQFKILKEFGVNLSEAPPFFRSQKSRASNYVGTIFYMAPEMVQSTICDEKSDLWAYGCIMYELFVGDFLHIEFDTPKLFQDELEKRLVVMSQNCSDPDALDLFKLIAHYQPSKRIEIEKVLKHPYFSEIAEERNRSQCREKFVRFLRGNYNISKEKSYPPFGIEGLNLLRGTEVYRQLKTIILLQVEQSFQFYEIISGPFYFKFRYCKNNENLDFRIRYDCIDRIIRRQGLLSLYYFANFDESILEVKTFKHLYPEFLEDLHRMMEIVVKQ